MGLNSASNGKVPHSIRKHRTDVTTISDCAHLQMMSVSGNYQLGADFSCAGTNFVPIGTWSAQFTGSLNGNGFSIDGLTISPIACGSGVLCAGLFGIVGGSASITNVRLTNENIVVDVTDGSAAYVGGIAAFIYSATATTSLSSVQGSIAVSGNSQNLMVGGLVGMSDTSVSTSSSNASLSASTSSNEQYPTIFVGGLVGEMDTANISNSGATGSVAASGPPSHKAMVGGLVGSFYCTAGATYTCAISGSYATGAVTDAAPGAQYAVEVGGLVGAVGGNYDSGDYAYVQQSSAAGNVTAGPYAYAGGLVGIVDASATVEQSFAIGSVTNGASGTVGGLVGKLGGATCCGSIDQSYSTGFVSDPNGTFVGGFVGQNSDGPITNSYWDLNASGINNPSGGCGNVPNCAGVTGLTTKIFWNGKLPTGLNAAAWEPMKTNAVPQGYYPQLWILPFPISTFPLPGFTPYTNGVITLFDHSLRTSATAGINGSSLTAALYSNSCDDAVLVFSGQFGLENYGQDTPTCDEAGYERDNNGDKFVINGIKYVGDASDKKKGHTPTQYLNYEGHPGIDFSATYVPFNAAVSGIVFYPYREVGTGRGETNYDTYCRFHALAEVPDSAATYRIIYLHAETHPNGLGLAGFPADPPCIHNDGYVLGQQAQIVSGQSPDCYSLNNIVENPQPTMLPLEPGTHVNVGCEIGVSGDAGVPGNPHLHFEIDRIVPSAALLQATQGVIAYFQCWDENNQYKTRTLHSYCVPADPYGWTGPSGSCDVTQWPPPPQNTDITDEWACLSAVPANRFWLQ